MSQLASLATNSLILIRIGKTTTSEFLSLADQLNDLSSTKFNGVRLFGSAQPDWITLPAVRDWIK